MNWLEKFKDKFSGTLPKRIIYTAIVFNIFAYMCLFFLGIMFGLVKLFGFGTILSIFWISFAFYIVYSIIWCRY